MNEEVQCQRKGYEAYFISHSATSVMFILKSHRVASSIGQGVLVRIGVMSDFGKFSFAVCICF